MSDSMIKKELSPIANMCPYLIRSLNKADSSLALKPYPVTRCKGIPQTSTLTDTAVMTVVLIEAHLGGSIDACKAITPRVLPSAAKQLVVKFFSYISSRPYVADTA